MFLLLWLFLFSAAATAAVADSLDTYSSNYTDCPIIECGSVNISYPFWYDPNPVPGADPSSYCGYRDFGITCPDNKTAYFTTLSDNYTVESINTQARTISLVDSTVVGNSCPQARHNVSISNIPALNFNPDVVGILFFFNCSADLVNDPRIPKQNAAGCLKNQSELSYVFRTDNWPDQQYVLGKLMGGCRGAPVESRVRKSDLQGNSLPDMFGKAMNKGFDLNWDLNSASNDNHMADCRRCEANAGKCGYKNGDGGQVFQCFCPDGSRNCYSKGKGHSVLLLRIIIGFIGASIVACLLIACLWIYLRRLCCSFGLIEEDQSFEAFLVMYGPLPLTRYQYSTIKKMTSSFTEKIGQGGYGSVFKGKLDDGRSVAVKILSDSKGTVEDFINEVASIGRTNHVNIVSLLGYCSEGSQRALIYEYMPNGSLDKHLFHKSLNITPLDWEQLFKIALGIAKGLEYLHQGCRTRIVHFDIKPHNILLDEEWCPKISDFGLAKLCLPKESVLSMVCARGTIGYIAPEVFSRNFGVVTSKSDVYSYGMMVLEMVGGRRNSDYQVDNTSEIYFPHWIYEHLDNLNDLNNYGITIETEEVAKKMIIVGLWCIQTSPTCRPSINKVVEMLEGGLEGLKMPPKPYICSPPRSDNPILQTDSLTSSMS